MSIQFLGGLPLIRSGQVATNSDCCCTPPCLPDVCVSPSVTNCFRCWDADCDGGSCLEWALLEFAISGVGSVLSIPHEVTNTAFCRDDWDCNCDVFNSSFIHSFASGSCFTNWNVREASPPYLAFDVCNINSGFISCGNYRIRRGVSVRVAVANEQVSYTSGVKTSITFPNYITVGSSATNSLVCCNNYTLQPGHYVIIAMTMVGQFAGTSSPSYYDTKWFIYGFGNGVKVDPACPDDQYYPNCGPYTGGNATMILSSRYSRVSSAISSPPVYIGDCGRYDELCDLSSATVTIEPPVVDPCEITPPPP